MPTITTDLTAGLATSLGPDSKGDLFVRDTNTPGFGLKVSPKGSKAWFVEFRVKGGRTRRVGLGKVLQINIQQARRQAKKMLAQAAQGVDPVQERQERKDQEKRAETLTLPNLLEEYAKARDLKPVTLRGYRRAVNLWLKPWENKPLGKITRQDVMGKHEALTEQAGPAAANLTMRVLRALFSYAKAVYGVKYGIDENPVEILKDAKTWNKSTVRTGHIRPELLAAWWQATEELKPVMRDYLQLVLLTGLRREEAASLAWENVDLEKRILTVPDTKNGTAHKLPIPDFLLALLTGRQADAAGPWVFPSAGKKGYIQEPKKATDRVGQTIGQPFSTHDLRRTFASIGESLDLPFLTLKALMNHKAKDITGRYVQISPDRMRGPMQAIEDYILKAAGAKPTGVVLAMKKSTFSN